MKQVRLGVSPNRGELRSFSGLVALALLLPRTRAFFQSYWNDRAPWSFKQRLRQRHHEPATVGCGHQAKLFSQPSDVRRFAGVTTQSQSSPPPPAKASTGSSSSSLPNFSVGACLGSGSYGTVHWLLLDADDEGTAVPSTSSLYRDDQSMEPSATDRSNEDQSKPRFFVGKRAWTMSPEDLQAIEAARPSRRGGDGTTNSAPEEKSSSRGSSRLARKQQQQQQQQQQHHAKRCRFYWQRENECYQKLGTKLSTPLVEPLHQASQKHRRANHKDRENNNEPSVEQEAQSLVGIPSFRGTWTDPSTSHTWLVWDAIAGLGDEDADIPSPPPSLESVFKKSSPFQTEKSSQTTASSSGAEQQNDQDLMEQQLWGTQPLAGFIRLAEAFGLVPQHSSFQESSGSEHDLSDLALQTFDRLVEQLLEVVESVHRNDIVHRDIKPGNLLLSAEKKQLFVIDFGSALDLSSSKSRGWWSLDNNENDSVVAISPLYAAPETYVNPRRPDEAKKFDCFSVGLILCQVLFQMGDAINTDDEERAYAAFHQRLEAADYDLNVWLTQEFLASDNVQANSHNMEEAFRAIVAHRPGLWRLLQGLLNPDPAERMSSTQAFQQWRQVRNREQQPAAQTSGDSSSWAVHRDLDGPLVAQVLETLHEPAVCEIPWTSDGDDEIEKDEGQPDSQSLPTSRIPRSYVVTFHRQEPLGLRLAETDAILEDYAENESQGDVSMDWEAFLKHEGGVSGQVYVTEVIPSSQAAAKGRGVISVGDRLLAVNGFPVADLGFDHALQLIQTIPESISRRRQYCRLHLQRPVRVASSHTTTSLDSSSSSQQDEGDKEIAPQKSASPASKVRILGYGAWSDQSDRPVQEDGLILCRMALDGSSMTRTTAHAPLQASSSPAMLLAGVLDGHLGTAAVQYVQEDLPSRLMGGELSSVLTEDLPSKLSRAWEATCESYRESCSVEQGECLADFDAREGRLRANVGGGGPQAVAGTTATLVLVSEDPTGSRINRLRNDNTRNQPHSPSLTLLNCGDSRGIVIQFDTEMQSSSENDDVPFRLLVETRDHKPFDEWQRFERVHQGTRTPNFMPECNSLNEWKVPVGNGLFSYSTSRSLEGTMATAAGIISTPELYHVSIPPSADNSTENKSTMTAIVLATDGLWDVMDTHEVALFIQNQIASLYGSSERRRSMQSQMKKGFPVMMGDEVQQIAKRLCDRAIRSRTKDNVSVVLVLLDTES